MTYNANLNIERELIRLVRIRDILLNIETNIICSNCLIILTSSFISIVISNIKFYFIFLKKMFTWAHTKLH